MHDRGGSYPFVMLWGRQGARQWLSPRECVGEPPGFTSATVEPIRKRNSKRELFEYAVNAHHP